MASLETLTIVIGTALALGSWTLLVKNNPIYRLTETIFVASGASYIFITSIYRVIDIGITPIITGKDISWIIPLALGVLLWTSLFPNYSIFSRYPSNILLGGALGVAMATSITSQIIKPGQSTIVPLFSGDLGTSINDLIVLIGLIAVISYFVFTLQSYKGANQFLNLVSKLGRYFIMMSFGAIVASGFYARVVNIISITSQAITPPGYWATILVIVATAAVLFLESKR